MVVNIIDNYSCMHVLLYAKMLKETENEDTRLFCHIFIICGISIGGPLAMPIIVTSMLFVILRFCVLLCLFALVCISKRH